VRLTDGLTHLGHRVCGGAHAPPSESAELLGVAQQTISRRLVGEVPFDVTELAQIAALLKVPATQFLGAVGRAA
jgi:transcriptional regulator with XRE-family HTH domain